MKIGPRTFSLWIWIPILVLVARAQELSGRETLRVVDWPSRFTAVPPALETNQAAWLPLLRLGMAGLGERQIIEVALAGPRTLGLDEAASARLRASASDLYREIESDPVWKNCPGLLEYCYAERQAARGRALVVQPAGDVGAETPVVIFLHGDGGLFTWYAYRLHRIFPEAMLVLPAYGIKPANAPFEYLDEALRAAWSGKPGSPPAPHVVGLSAGGFAVQRQWARRPDAYAGVLVLGTYVPAEVAESAPRSARAAPSFIIGADEPFIRDEAAIRDMSALRRREPRTVVRQIPGADHFFLLTHADITTAHMREWLYPTLNRPSR